MSITLHFLRFCLFVLSGKGSYFYVNYYLCCTQAHLAIAVAWYQQTTAHHAWVVLHVMNQVYLTRTGYVLMGTSVGTLFTLSLSLSLIALTYLLLFAVFCTPPSPSAKNWTVLLAFS